MTQEPPDASQTAQEAVGGLAEGLWSPEQLANIITKVAIGVEPLKAARSEGIAERDWNEWLEWGRDDRQPFAELLAQIEQAEIDAEVLAIGRISAAAREGSWQAAAWIAERRWPERWARKSIQGKDAPREGELPANVRDPFADLDNVAQLRPRG